ncbi:YoaK family protein [Paraburkholderia dilworthii]|uniref:YoaK family protein n=1 Tax=Paraburkholderia dilworthii TaxID=948106 RepID=A0ABW9DEN4_9BURK
MPINYLRAFTSPTRTDNSNRRLGCALAFVAGAANAGGFLAVGQYTSHMSGIVSSFADNLILGQVVFVASAAGSVAAFLLGAASSAILINWGRQHGVQSVYATPLLLEAILLLCFGLLGANLEAHRVFYMPLTVALLCFVMGLQNAMITKISKAEIRTTHVTGLVTDIGIELGKSLYWNRGMPLTSSQYVRADRRKLALLTSLLCSFLAGGVAGAFGFKQFGFIATVPLAAVLLVFTGVPVGDDLTTLRRRRRL